MYVLILYLYFSMSDKSEEDKQKTWKEEWLPNTVLPYMDKLEKRFKEKEWFVTDKVGRRKALLIIRPKIHTVQFPSVTSLF